MQVLDLEIIALFAVKVVKKKMSSVNTENVIDFIKLLRDIEVTSFYTVPRVVTALT